jgi:hypothetical protein
VVGVVLAAACHPSPQVTTRTVTMYVPQACAADGGAYGDYFALGDYDPSTPPPTTGHPLSAVGVALPEIDSRALELMVTATENDATWEGVAPVPASGDVDVLVLPAFASCALTSGGDAGVPLGPRTGSVLAAIGAEQALLVGGSAPPGMAFPSTFVASMTTGAVQPVTVDLRTPRTNASVTPFGGGALVAGGYDTVGTILDTAEIYSTATGGFDQQTSVTLSEYRGHHGAVVLASGQTLLVGGMGGPDGMTPLSTMEIVNPSTPPTVREQDVEPLVAARSDPTVLRLASGEILVAGGVDASGAPVQTLEWFAADASSRTVMPQTLAQGPGSAFLALEGGGALAVLTPPSPAPSGFQNVWIIDASGVLEPAVPLATNPTAPVLFGGAGGAPVLYTGSAWLRWEPYLGAFGEFGELDNGLPSISATARCSPDPGLGMWLDESQQQLFALRFDTSNEYSTVVGPLLATDTSDTSPDTAPSGSVTFDPQTGLTLAPAAGVFVTDRTYADVAIDLDAPTPQAAFVEIRDDAGDVLDVGSDVCPGAVAVEGGPASSSVHVERHGSQVTWSLAGGGGSGTCTFPGGETVRVSVGVRGTSVQSVAQNLVVQRLGEP